METSIGREGDGKEGMVQAPLNPLPSLWILWGVSEKRLMPRMTLRKCYQCKFTPKQQDQTAEVKEAGGLYHKHYTLSFIVTPGDRVPIKVLKKDHYFFTESPSLHIQIYK